MERNRLTTEELWEITRELQDLNLDSPPALDLVVTLTTRLLRDSWSWRCGPDTEVAPFMVRVWVRGKSREAVREGMGHACEAVAAIDDLPEDGNTTSTATYAWSIEVIEVATQED